MKTIYYLYDKRENLPRYVGVTSLSLNKRFQSHRCSKGNSKREKWIQSVGEFLRICEIEKCEDDKAEQREIYWIQFYFESLVNLRIGKKASDELKKIFSDAQKKKPLNWDALKKAHSAVKGKKRREGWGDNLRMKLKNRPKNVYSVEKMKKHHVEKYGIKVSINGIIYESIGDASKSTGISKATIRLYIQSPPKKKKFDIQVQ